MKKFILFAAVSAFSLSVFANETPKTKNGSPKVYIMLTKGRLIEVKDGHKKFIRKDVTLLNNTTIHPNGAIDAGSGQSLQLKEGEYITMDGRIRKFKDKKHHHPTK